eukprot:COSAG01_NODE_2700_length_7232_cov_3.028876_5_plen_37_part_00
MHAVGKDAGNSQLGRDVVGAMRWAEETLQLRDVVNN